MPGRSEGERDMLAWLLEVTRRTAAPQVRQDESDANRLKNGPEGPRTKG